MKIEIKSIYGSILFSFEKENNTVKDTLLEAIKSGANLSCAYLRCADLSDADLSDADLSDANLSRANLSDANLRDAYLSGANLSCANLRDAYLSGANLSGAYLRCAYLRDANLSCAYLRCADLSDANLSRANLSDANLSGANLSGANHSEITSFFLPQCPSEGSFIAWKKAHGMIVKLQICEYAQRSSATTLKCRCSAALVLEIQNIDGSKSDLKEIKSEHDSDFIYRVGEIASVDNFDGDRFKDCSAGIHFFIAREMAVRY